MSASLLCSWFCFLNYIHLINKILLMTSQVLKQKLFTLSSVSIETVYLMHDKSRVYFFIIAKWSLIWVPNNSVISLNITIIFVVPVKMMRWWYTDDNGKVRERVPKDVRKKVDKNGEAIFKEWRFRVFVNIDLNLHGKWA